MTYITDIIYITHITYITHMVKLIFKAYKKLIKHFLKMFFLYIKILTRYYQKNKDRLQIKACERYQYLPEKGKNKKRQYARDQYYNLSEEEKTKSVRMVVNNIEIFPKMKKID